MNKLIHRLITKWPKLSLPSKYVTSNVNTLTPLASAFNNPKTKTREKDQSVGLFGISELRNCDGFHILKENVLQTADVLVNEAIALSPSLKVASVFDTLSDELCKVADLAEFVRLVHPEPSYSDVAENTSFEIGGFVEKLNTHYELYMSLNNAYIHDKENMDDVTAMVTKLFLFDFEQSGIHLDSDKRKLAVELHEAVLVLGARFAQGTALPRNYQVSNWPVDLKIPYALDKDVIIVDGPFSESTNAKLRHACYKAYMSPCEEQRYLLDKLFHCRHELAAVLGFESYAHRTLNGTMAQTPATVINFLEDTLAMLEKPLEHEMKTISAYKKTFDSVNNEHLTPIDVKYYTGHITSQMYNLNSKHIREYFSIGACMEGLNVIFTSLYGVSLNVVGAELGEVWQADVQKVEVRHEHEGVLGHIYCDFYQRAGKLAQDCHFTIRGGKLLADGTYQSPIVCLVCNFPPPRYDQPSLLSQGMVENLFHEMGHAMHSMLGRARYQHVTGTRCATDFAEVPSILMEYFAMDPRILLIYAKHYKTGQSLPEEIIKAISASKKLFAATELQVQAFYSIVDQTFHGRHPLVKSTNDLLDDLHRQYFPLTHVSGSAWHLRFSHFHSYGAKYYAYVWSKAVASRVWYSCFEKDPLSRSAGERYRVMMLKHGGGRPPQQMVEDMLGRNISVNDLVSSLKADLHK